MGCSSSKNGKAAAPVDSKTNTQETTGEQVPSTLLTKPLPDEKTQEEQQAKQKVTATLKNLVEAVPASSKAQVVEVLRKIDPKDRERMLTVLDALEAEAALRKVFDSLSKDEKGFVATGDLTTAFTAAPELPSLMAAAFMNPHAYVVQQLTQWTEERVDYEKVLTFCKVPMDLKVGQIALEMSTKKVGKVVKRTTTDVQLALADGSTKWEAIDDVRLVMPRQSENKEGLCPVEDEVQGKPDVVTAEQDAASVGTKSFWDMFFCYCGQQGQEGQNSL